MLFLLCVAQPGYLIPSALTPAYGDTQSVGKGLLVAPIKLDFVGRVRSGTLKVMNRDARDVDYRVSLTSLIEKDKGTDAREMIRFSPRKIHLGPGEHQTIRVVVRKPENLTPGEYTARLLIQAIPPVRKPTEEPVKDIQVNLDIVYGVSIPIHIQHNP